MISETPDYFFEDNKSKTKVGNDILSQQDEAKQLLTLGSWIKMVSKFSNSKQFPVKFSRKLNYFDEHEVF